MALSAALSVNLSSVRSRQPVNFSLVISNSGGSDVTATGIVPYASTAAVAGEVGAPKKFGTTTWTIPAGGSLAVGWPGELAANANALGTNTVYDITARVETADENLVSNTISVSVAPIAPSSRAIPVRGMTRFDLNLNSYLLCLI